jgi:hypothetical protein
LGERILDAGLIAKSTVHAVVCSSLGPLTGGPDDTISLTTRTPPGGLAIERRLRRRSKDTLFPIRPLGPKDTDWELFVNNPASKLRSSAPKPSGSQQLLDRLQNLSRTADTFAVYERVDGLQADSRSANPFVDNIIHDTLTRQFTYQSVCIDVMGDTETDYGNRHCRDCVFFI